MIASIISSWPKSLTALQLNHVANNMMQQSYAYFILVNVARTSQSQEYKPKHKMKFDPCKARVLAEKNCVEISVPVLLSLLRQVGAHPQNTGMSKGKRSNHLPIPLL